MRDTLDLFQRITSELLEDEKSNPVAKYIPSKDVFKHLDLNLNEGPITDEEFEKVLRELVLSSPRTASKGFFNQLFGGRNDKAVLGDLLSVILNNSMYTYKAAGPQIAVEKVIIRKICDFIGWDENANGTLAPGGSMTNFMGMLMARDHAKAKSKVSIEKMTVYTSKESHYSIPKNVAFCGIGRENLNYVNTDEKGRIDPKDLEKQIINDLEKGLHPTMVNLTAGTTVLGAFDPIIPVAELCKKHNIWLHIDGAYCGSVIFSERYRHYLDGKELADSFTLNAHKMLGTPLSCSIIVVKDEQFLFNSFSNEASYLYQTDHDGFNLGKTSLQCGRRNDALKLWTLWKKVGTKGLEELVDHQFYLAEVARKYIRENKDYTLYSFDDSISVCFNYKNRSARRLCTELYEHSKLMVGYGQFGDDEFVRFVTVNAQNKKQDIIDFFKTLEDFANNV
jgi:sulfinoalanine decarboxylase/sulfinoalanine decarboxylase/aspartate 1-decarboxylase